MASSSICVSESWENCKDVSIVKLANDEDFS